MSKPKKPNKKSKLLPNLVYGYHVPGIDDLVYAASMDELADDPSATDGIKVGIYELKEVRMLQRTVTLE